VRERPGLRFVNLHSFDFPCKGSFNVDEDRRSESRFKKSKRPFGGRSHGKCVKGSHGSPRHWSQRRKRCPERHRMIVVKVSTMLDIHNIRSGTLQEALDGMGDFKQREFIQSLIGQIKKLNGFSTEVLTGTDCPRVMKIKELAVGGSSIRETRSDSLSHNEDAHTMSFIGKLCDRSPATQHFVIGVTGNDNNFHVSGARSSLARMSRDSAP